MVVLVIGFTSNKSNGGNIYLGEFCWKRDSTGGEIELELTLIKDMISINGTVFIDGIDNPVFGTVFFDDKITNKIIAGYTLAGTSGFSVVRLELEPSTLNGTITIHTSGGTTTTDTVTKESCIDSSGGTTTTGGGTTTTGTTTRESSKD